jgi:hypothetical protein
MIHPPVTVRHYLSELAETLPQRASANAIETGLVSRFRERTINYYILNPFDFVI